MSISANQPIAVLSGNPEISIGSDPTISDQVTSFLVPTSDWGSQFVIPGLPGVQTYSVKIVAAESQTEIRVDGGWQEFTLNSGEFVMVDITDNRNIFIDATSAIQVVQYLHGYRAPGEFSAPASILIPATSHYAKDYFFSFTGSSFAHYAIVTVPSANITGLEIDGSMPLNSGWVEVPNSYPQMSIQTFPVSS